MDEIRQTKSCGSEFGAIGFNAVGGVIINIITYDPLPLILPMPTVRGGTRLCGPVSTPHAGDAGLRLSLGGFRANEFSTSSRLRRWVLQPITASFLLQRRRGPLRPMSSLLLKVP
jgi:hypothetical protein